MDLILWRHADAEDGSPDLARKLTPQGRAQAARVAAWLLARLPSGFELLASPAVRAEETAQALSPTIQSSPLLAPGATPESILRAAGWPDPRRCVILVGHQPDFGCAAAYLVCGEERDWRIDKGALWWLRGERQPMSIRAVVSPDLL